jgi:acyl-CoA hydrolase/GNAT superfamily N-acetyltransferase
MKAGSDYWSKLRSAEEVAALIRPGSRLFIGSGAGEPQTIIKALNERLRHTEDTEIIHVLTLGLSPYDSEPFARNVRYSAVFIGPTIRDAVQQGRGDYIPLFFSEMPRQFRTGRIRLDFALISVSPPDRCGFCSYGVNVDVVKAAAESARVVIAEVNRRMPRTLGDSFIHLSQIHHVVESDVPILELTHPPPNDVAVRIGGSVASLIEDGATIQAGIGTIPDATLPFLREKNDMGVHTEMFSDGIIELFENGNITNRKKTLHRDKIVAAFCMGSRRLYEFVDNNPLIEFHPIDYTNDPFVIAQNERMTSINGAIQIDLTGQVVADSIGYYLYSGFGGQVDFTRGAARSKGGKPIIVLPSTAKKGTVSRIVPTLSPGAGVVTSRADVHWVITEHGVAYLHGKSLRERAMKLISIAHPDFRDELLDEAKRLGYIPQDQLPLTPSGRYYPEKYERTEMFAGGLAVRVRPIKPTDEPLEREFFYRLSDETVYFRFFSYLKALPHEKLQHLVNIDYHDEMALVGVIGPPENEEIICIGRYNRDPATNLAEVAFVVRDDMQNRGIGTFLLKYLAQIAQERGLYGFTAEVLASNQRMMKVLNKAGLKVETRIEEDTYVLRIVFG